MKRVTMQLDGRVYMVEVAGPGDESSKGLSGRRHLSRDSGMLIDFGSTGRHALWMHDTHFPLDAAFLDESMTVLGVATLMAHDETHVASPEGCRYALEMPYGTLGEDHVGARVTVLGEVASY